MTCELVDEDERVARHVFEEGRRRLARLAAGQIARIVLDPGAAAGRLDHLQIVGRALLEPLRLEQFPFRVELVEADLEVALDLLDRLQQGRPRRHVMAVGVDLDRVQRRGLLAGQRVDLMDRLDLVAEQRDAPGAVFVMRREQFDRVAAHPERAAEEIVVVAPVLQFDKAGEQLGAVDPVALGERQGHLRIGLDRADAVDAGDRGDDDDIAALEDRARRRVAHPVDLLVQRRFLLDIGIGARDIGLGLVIIVIRDEILDRVLREEALHFAVELRGQGLVRGENDRRAPGALDDMRHREGLARAGDAEQHLLALAAGDPLAQFLDRLRLVAGRLEFGLELERPADIALRPLGGHQRQHRYQVEGVSRFHARHRTSGSMQARI